MAAQRAVSSDPVDISRYRDDFPVLKRPMNGKPLAFLDSGASAQKPQAVIDAMNAVLEGGYSERPRPRCRLYRRAF
jgi:cysteine desulfurase/selenocysteine lyase